MNIGELLAEYERSYFTDRDFVPGDLVITPAEKKRAIAEYDASPLKCLMANVEESRRDVRETAGRMRLAKQDGLLDRDAYRSASKEEKTRWRRAVEVVRGDWQRAVTELAHWREYVEWELGRQRAKAADTRLPPEGERDGEMRSTVQGTERTDHPGEQPGAGGVRDDSGQDGQVP